MTALSSVRTRLSMVGVLVLLWAGTAWSQQKKDSGNYEFSVPIEVSGLPAGAQFVPVFCPIDFRDLQDRVKAPGAVDERSLRLYRVLPGGGRVEEPVQFLASSQPRAKTRQLLPGTVKSVSYTTEYRTAETPAARVSGTLCWIARAATEPVARYILQFGVPREGRMIQVPFPPQNLRAFDSAGRASPIRHFPRMQIRPQSPLNGVLHISDLNQLVTSYHVGPVAGQAGSPTLGVRRPFFYPVLGPDGVSLTEFGKPHDPTGSHAHHYSLWIAHSNVAGQDFWSEKGGVIANAQLELLEDGPIFCRVIQNTRWISGNIDVLRERRTITVYHAARDFRLMDFDLEYAPAGAKGVELGKTTFGFLAVRVAQSMTPFDGGGEILNAQGDRNEQSVHLKRAAWLDQSGPIAAAADGSAGVSPPRWGGIAMMDNPHNKNHPTAWHCRNDGWAGASFNFAGPHTIAAGEKLQLSYRVHLHRHNAVEGQVAKRYEEYRSEPTIRLGEPTRAE